MTGLIAGVGATGVLVLGGVELGQHPREWWWAVALAGGGFLIGRLARKADRP